ncbi:MAG TPA: YncE family protein [Acidimicrobiia bacterium]|nr:YncE family protein [Acidimicrobiia bacterium]
MPRARTIGAVVLAAALGVGAAIAFLASDPNHRVAPLIVEPSSSTARSTTTAVHRTRAPRTTTTAVPAPPAITRVLHKLRVITGAISPKSVTATGTGLVFAQNMMYRHTMTVYDHDGSLVRTIPDSVEFDDFGLGGHPGVSRGAPVEAAVDHAHRKIFVTNYSMYGADFGPEGSDECKGPSGLSRSFVYRIDLRSLAIDGVAQVGMVPKYVAVTPDDRYVLVTNWCSYDVSVVDHDQLREIRRIPLGAYPRGIAVDPTSRVAYIAVMGSYDVARLDLRSFELTWFRGVGNAPRHLVLSPDGRRLYVTLNGANRVVAVDTRTGKVVATVATGKQPRSMAMSTDGSALYIVNYASNTVAVVRASDLHLVRLLHVPSHPIGITFEPVEQRVWVACYSGAIIIYGT